jgi:periplasmic mercuric ion binding protein
MEIKMGRTLALMLFSTALFTGGTALGAERTLTLQVQNLVCHICALRVQRSLSQVKGVIRIEVSAEKETATVTFDDAETNADALIAATKNAGFPSRVAH